MLRKDAIFLAIFVLIPLQCHETHISSRNVIRHFLRKHLIRVKGNETCCPVLINLSSAWLFFKSCKWLILLFHFYSLTEHWASLCNRCLWASPQELHYCRTEFKARGKRARQRQDQRCARMYRLFEGKDHAFIYHKYRIAPPEEVKNLILQYLEKKVRNWKVDKPYALAVPAVEIQDGGCRTLDVCWKEQFMHASTNFIPYALNGIHRVTWGWMIWSLNICINPWLPFSSECLYFVYKGMKHGNLLNTFRVGL